MKNYKFTNAQGTEITRAEAFERLATNKPFATIELINNKYNGTYENYIPRYAR